VFLFRKKEPAIMYVIIGEQLQRDIPEDALSEEREFIESFNNREKYSPPDYDTDPRKYDLPVFNEVLSDEQFESEYREKVRAFFNKKDALKFASYCNMVTVRCPVYIKNGKEWEYSSKLTGKMADYLC
jgi:hypothetical protein